MTPRQTVSAPELSALITRRTFLGSCALGGTSILLTARRSTNAQSANSKLNIGLIGVGGKGADNMKNLASENIVALCDVDENSLNKGAELHPQAQKYRDFRKLLEQKDIDAVVVSTPDHTHAVAAMMAIKLGKHVYCEKPLTHSLEEARSITLAAREYKVATQMGNGAHASNAIREVVEWVQAGVIGPVREAHAWSNRPIWPQGIERPADTPAVPAALDWNLWLGPAPERPYHPAYHPFKWRGFWDFGTGALGDMGCHIIDTPFWALKLGHPSAVEASGVGQTKETGPKASTVTYHFPERQGMPELTLTWHDGGNHPPRELAGLAEGQAYPQNGSLYLGDKGKIFVEHGKSPRFVPESADQDFKPPDKSIPRSPGHYIEWIEACKGGKPAGSNFDYAGPLTELVLLGNVALRAGKRLEWDGANLRATNAPDADQFIRRSYREGWSL